MLTDLPFPLFLLKKGTGILGLPVKLAHTGFTPLVATYTFIFVMQVGLIFFLIEVLQRARVEFQKTKSEEPVPEEEQAISGNEATMDDEGEVKEKPTNMVELDVEQYDGLPVQKPGTSLSKGEDLHSLSVAYLHPWLRRIFDIAITIHFLSLLITYTLAASEAYGQLFGLHNGWIWLAIPFVIIFSCVVIFGSRFLDPVVSVFTFSKAGLLVLMVIITAVVSANVNLEISNDWRYIGRPFLIGTVALGGVYNILPVAFEKVRFHSRQVKIFTACAVAGLTLVYLFNLGWCYFVLRIVPQMPSAQAPGADGTETDSLYGAEQNGQISTVPLVNIIRRDHPKYRWIAVVVMLFTMVSITVSFVVNSMAWKHYLEGLIASLSPTRALPQNALHRAWIFVRNLRINWKRAILFGTSFTFILVVALFNPKSFLKIMEKVTSFAANGTAACVCWMLHRSRVISPVSIPWQMPSWLWQARWVVMTFFIGSMVYNIVATIAGAAGVKWL